MKLTGILKDFVCMSADKDTLGLISGTLNYNYHVEIGYCYKIEVH
jgi:hypothetical protein